MEQALAERREKRGTGRGGHGMRGAQVRFASLGETRAQRLGSYRGTVFSARPFHSYLDLLLLSAI